MTAIFPRLVFWAGWLVNEAILDSGQFTATPVVFHSAFAQIGQGQPAIVLKIETVKGFGKLPAMVLEAMSATACGLMIARGDLAGAHRAIDAAQGGRCWQHRPLVLIG